MKTLAAFLFALMSVAVFCLMGWKIVDIERGLKALRCDVASSASLGIRSSHWGKRFSYGRYELCEFRSLYAKDGDRWIPVYDVTEVTTNLPPCRSIDRTGLWYAPCGGTDPKKMRDGYVPPRPLWEEVR